MHPAGKLGNLETWIKTRIGGQALRVMKLLEAISISCAHGSPLTRARNFLLVDTQEYQSPPLRSNEHIPAVQDDHIFKQYMINFFMSLFTREDIRSSYFQLLPRLPIPPLVDTDYAVTNLPAKEVLRT
jgi:hypothetical protein